MVWTTHHEQFLSSNSSISTHWKAVNSIDKNVNFGDLKPKEKLQIVTQAHLWIILKWNAGPWPKAWAHSSVIVETTNCIQTICPSTFGRVLIIKQQKNWTVQRNLIVVIRVFNHQEKCSILVYWGHTRNKQKLSIFQGHLKLHFTA